MANLALPKYIQKMFPKAFSQLNSIINGFIYNDVKNSFAIGNKVTATGNDQFVFGKYNKEDANKAEIVGGGSEGGYEIGQTITQLVVPPTQIAAGVTTNGGTLNNATIVATNYESFVSYVKENIANRDKVFWSVESISASDIAFVLFINKQNTGVGTIQNYYFIDTNGFVYETSQGGSSSVSQALTFSKLVTLGKIAIPDGSKNIRTLDWNGNEKITGNIEIAGGTIKLGNTSINEQQLINLLSLIH